MTEQELTALAKEKWRSEHPTTAMLSDVFESMTRERDALLVRIDTLQAERDALKAQLAAVTGRALVSAQRLDGPHVVRPTYGCTCHSLARCPLHAWTNQPV